MLRPRNLFAFAAVLLLGVSLAFAHAHPKVMTPGPDSVGPAPAAITITFSEPIEPRFSSIRLTDASDHAIPTGAAHSGGDASTLTLPVQKLASGVYIVHWISVATDGHRLAGQYKFTVR
jgi:methionine-rich copper-binding protein CopC